MINSPKSWQFNIEKSKEFLAKAERLSHFSLDLLHENRSIAKVLFELHKSVIHLIKAFLDLEQKQIKITNEPKKDIMAFFEKIAPKYLDKSQIKTLFSILTLTKKHKDSHLEFVKSEKFVIFSGKDYKTITKEHLNAMILAIKGSISRFPLKA